MAMVWDVRRAEAGETAFEALKALKAEGYNVLMDLTAIDWSALSAGSKGDASDAFKRAVPMEQRDVAHPIAAAEGEEYGTPKQKEPTNEFLKPRPSRFEVVYRLAKIDADTGNDNGRCEVRVYVDEGSSDLRSIASLYPIADWLEREIWDMFGVKFADRPDIKRLLLYEEFKGHPLRKDYPITRRQPLVGPANGERADSPTFNIIKPTVKYD